MLYVVHFYIRRKRIEVLRRTLYFFKINVITRIIWISIEGFRKHFSLVLFPSEEKNFEHVLIDAERWTYWISAFQQEAILIHMNGSSAWLVSESVLSTHSFTQNLIQHWNVTPLVSRNNHVGYRLIRQYFVQTSFSNDSERHLSRPNSRRSFSCAYRTFRVTTSFFCGRLILKIILESSGLYVFCVISGITIYDWVETVMYKFWYL